MPADGRWLLLIHQIPAKPDYLRVKIGRRLAKVGAVSLKKTVYALPRSEAAREDFDWLRAEIAGAGGDALVIEAGMAAGASDAEIEDLFRRARDADYVALAEHAREIRRATTGRRIAERRRPGLLADVAKLERRFDEIVAIDFFGAPSREPARASVAELRARLAPSEVAVDTTVERPPRGATWVTRSGVHVDRIACAWLIRRFIDPEARLKFVAPRGYAPALGELRFDMEGAEHTHEGDDCTFEVLVRRFDCRAHGLRAIGEIVHDIDLKDGRFGRPETPGVAAAIAGIGLLHREDEARIAAGSALFEALLAAFSRRSAAHESRR
ncbi:MAG: chromate resistance protein [Sandaracinaceae bacterium]|nr:chromate resistance protein [Sandaracinaceae bacterium]